MSAVAEHDLASLHTVVVGHCDLAEGDLQQGRISVERIAKIRAGFIAYAGLVAAEFFRNGIESVAGERFDLNELTRRTIHDISSVMGNGIHMSLLGGTEAMEIAGNSLLMFRLLLNLCFNARNACENRNGGKIVITTLVAHGAATISVRDNGCGMNTKQLAALAVPTIASEDAEHGHGMTMVRAAVEKLGGSISINSTEGEGSTFEVTLPLAH